MRGHCVEEEPIEHGLVLLNQLFYGVLERGLAGFVLAHYEWRTHLLELENVCVLFEPGGGL